MFTLPTMLFYAVIGVLVVCVVVLFLMVGRLKKRVSTLTMTLIVVQEQLAGATRTGSSFETTAQAPLARPSAGSGSGSRPRVSSSREPGRASVQEKRPARAAQTPGGSPTVRPAAGAAKAAQRSLQQPTVQARPQASGPGMRPNAAPGGQASDPRAADEYFGRGGAPAQGGAKKGRGKPVIPFGQDRAARDRAFNKYANEAVEQDIAPDSIDFSKVAPKLNAERGRNGLGVYDASNARRIKGNANRRR